MLLLKLPLKKPLTELELELELILSQMAQKPMLRGEVGAKATHRRSFKSE